MVKSEDVTEVFHQQSPELQELLLQTSILERFNASLCAAVSGHSDEQATFALLEQTDLFLVPLDEEEGWYRYYHLFRDFLSSMNSYGSPLLSLSLVFLRSEHLTSPLTCDSGRSRIELKYTLSVISAKVLYDEEARYLASVLDEATSGLAAPAIPSDRPLRPGSLVYYR